MKLTNETRHRESCTAVDAVASGGLHTPWSAAIRVDLAGEGEVGEIVCGFLVTAWEVAPCADPRCPAERRTAYRPKAVATRPRGVHRAGAAARRIEALSAGGLRYSSLVTATTR